MLTLRAQVINVFVTPTGTNDQGQQYGGAHKVQLLGRNILKNGEEKAELLTLGTDRPDLYQPFIGREINVPVSVWMMKGTMGYSIPPQSVPSPATTSSKGGGIAAAMASLPPD